MKVSTLIKRLQELQDYFGDLDVGSYNYGNDTYSNSIWAAYRHIPQKYNDESIPVISIDTKPIPMVGGTKFNGRWTYPNDLSNYLNIPFKPSMTTITFTDCEFKEDADIEPGNGYELVNTFITSAAFDEWEHIVDDNPPSDIYVKIKFNCLNTVIGRNEVLEVVEVCDELASNIVEHRDFALELTKFIACNDDTLMLVFESVFVGSQYD